MSDFFEQEAEEGTTEESDVSAAEDAGGTPKRKKKEKKKKTVRHVVDSDDEDEEEGEDLDQDLEGLIDDNPVDDDDGEDEGGKDSEESEIDDELEDDEIDLLEENLGIKIDRSKKRKRIRTQISSDEESEAEGEDREKIARHIFVDDDDEVASDREQPREVVDQVSQDLENIDEQEEGEESDYDDFIVDDEGQPISKMKKKKMVHNDAQLQEAQDIFGVDFDFDEFDQYDEEYDEDEEEEEDEYEDEEDAEGEVRPKPKKIQKKKQKGKSIYQLIEPSELERGFHTDVDQEIRTADMPERFQLRSIPVCPTEEGELDEEAEWIYKYAFATPPISQQDLADQSEGMSFRDGRFQSKSESYVMKIKKALNFMRNQQFEVPFIAFYRKEYVETELNINNLWKVYHWDEKWMQLRSRKQNLIRLFEKMQVYQFEQIDPDKPLDSHIRALTEEDITRAKNVQTMEELRDVYQHFMLYYGPDIPKMKMALKEKKRREREGKTGEAQHEEENEEDDRELLKQSSRKTGYTICIQAGLAELARKFGMSPESFAENLRDNYGRNNIEQDPAHPQELAQEFVCEQFSTPEDVLKGARHVVAMQIAHEPLIRECVRTAVQDRAKISLHPTKKGMKEIDESHQCYTFKYLKNKPVQELANDQFLKIVQAEEDGLLTYELHVDLKDVKNVQTYFDEIKSLFLLDEYSNLVQDWNNEREQALQRALTSILYPQLLKELKCKLLDEAKDHIIKSSSRRLYNWLKVAPYQMDQQLDDDEFDARKGLKVMGVSFSQNRDESAFCCIIDDDGEVTDYMRLRNLTKRKNAWRPDDREDKEKDLAKLKNFIANKKPHVIGVIAESRDALMIQEDLKALVLELEEENQIIPINVELIDSELASVFANSKKAESDFREYPEVLRQAISVARRLQDPLIEFCQLCNPDEDILALKYHPLQDAVSKEALLEALYLEFINRVNEVGVNVDACVSHPHKSSLIQFVCGLGPRKGFHLLKILRQKGTRLENRTQLVTMCRMGPKVFINCAGFIKIDTSALGDSTEAYVEVLDGSRVHPETYDWARKMAVDALEYDDTAEDANPAGALEEILESPERLRDLDLDAFAVELEKQGYGNRQITLYDIRAELNHRYKDLRTPYQSPTPEEKFNMLTKETPATFHIGKLIMCTVTGIAHKRPRGEQLDEANPYRNDETGLWQCPFCQKNDFPELSEVWNHFDAGECKGQPVGVKTRLDNGVSGFIPLSTLSDKRVEDPEQRVQVGMTLHCRITKIDIEKFQVELTSRTSDLIDKEGKWKLQKDLYYDYEREENDKKREAELKQKQARQTYVKRVIAHPSFHNIDYKSTIKLMANMEPGEVVIRPSSKGTDHLTATWKVTDSILQHIDIREEGKGNAFSLGKSLWIQNEEFEDLDEIIARHIQPMAAFVRDILNYKYYKDSDGGNREIMEKICIEEKKKAPSKIPYFFTASKEFPGKFMLSYLPRKTVRHEFVTVTSDGIRYRQQLFTSLNSLVKWFKEHFRDPIPGTPAGMRTPVGQAGIGATPNINLQNVDVATIQRAAAGLPSSVYNSLAQVAGQTPFGNFNQFQQPTPMMTPMMTPAQQQPFVTPAGIGTPMASATQGMAGQFGGHSSWQSSTPRVQTGTTPRQYAGTTPRPLPGQVTPRPGQATPRQQPGPTTPRHFPAAASPRHGALTPRQYVGSSTPAGHTPRQNRATPSAVGPSASQDWGKMAKMWAKERLAAEQGGTDYDSTAVKRSRRTPRSEQSPHIATPRGDATPLFDER